MTNSIPPLNQSWPESWKVSYHYDMLELTEGNDLPGYRFAYKNRFAHTLSLVRKYTSPPARILDIAAAQGNFSLALAQAGYDVTWNDLREELVGYVRLKGSPPSLRFLPGDLFKIDIQEQFDLILLPEVIEHVAHPDQLLVHVASMVKNGGLIVITTPNGSYFRFNHPRFSECPDPAVFESKQFRPDADGHIFLLHAEELRELGQRAGLACLEMQLFNCPLTNGHLKLRYILPYLPQWFVDSVEKLTTWLPSPILERGTSNIAAVFRKRGSR